MIPTLPAARNRKQRLSNHSIDSVTHLDFTADGKTLASSDHKGAHDEELAEVRARLVALPKPPPTDPDTVVVADPTAQPGRKAFAAWLAEHVENQSASAQEMLDNPVGALVQVRANGKTAP